MKMSIKALSALSVGAALFLAANVNSLAAAELKISGAPAVAIPVIAPNKAVSYAVIGAGGFLSAGRHDVAIPVSQLRQVDGKFVLAGATKDALKALPPFEYAR